MAVKTEVYPGECLEMRIWKRMLKLVRTTELCKYNMVVQQFILGFLTKFDKRILMAGAPPMPKESQHLPPPATAVGETVGESVGETGSGKEC